MDIPDQVALAQPVLYILGFVLIAILGIFAGLIKWLMDKYVTSLDNVVNKLVLQNDEQLVILRDIQAKVDSPPSDRKPRRRL